MNETKIFRLVDGTYVIGKVGDEFVTDIVDLALSNDGQGGVRVNLMPFMFPFNREMTGMFVKDTKVLAEMDAPEEMIKEYVVATTGIVTAQSIPTDIKNLGKPASNLKIIK